MARNIKFDKFIFIPIIVFSSLFLPFIKTIPYLDGNIDFVKSYDFYAGGFTQLFANWSSVHPPFKEYLTLIFFKIFGLSAFPYILLGFIFGILAIIIYYLLVKTLFNDRVAQISSVLLSACPIFIAVGIFTLTDFLLTSVFLITLYFYSKNRLLLYSIFASLAYLTKETGLVLAVSVLIIETIFLFKQFSFKRLSDKLIILLPFLVNYLWIYFTKINNKALWSDWNFADTASRGTLYTIFNNLITLNILNPYAYQNWLQLFVLNFNWVYWLIIIIGLAFTVYKYGLKNIFFAIIRNQHLKSILVIFLTFAGYFMAVLSFQTYTIPRYALPLYPFLLLGAAVSIYKIKDILKFPEIYIYLATIPFLLISLFTSIDPISKHYWGTTNVLGQNLYGVNRSLDGNDGITYNLQYVLIANKRSKFLMKKEGNLFSANDCSWLLADPNNDFKTFKILNIDPNSITNLCQR